MRRRPNKPGAPAEDDPAVARERALRLLARREHSARELKYKLEQRGISDQQASAAVETLAAAGWQSDERYVSSLIRHRVAQGYGPLRIVAELESSGVSSALIRNAMAQVEADWQQLAQQAWARRYSAPPASAADWQKQYRFLAGRGFDAAQIRAVLKGDGGAAE